MSEHSFDYIIGEDLPVEIIFDYQPGEPMTWGHPGEHASVEILGVLSNGIDFGAELSRSCLSKIEGACYAHIRKLKSGEIE